MPRQDRTVIVKDIPGEHMRFHVESWTHPAKPHLVDLLAHDGRGECSCADWQTRRWPLIRDGESRGTRCRHVIAARDHFLTDLLERMATQSPRHDYANA